MRNDDGAATGSASPAALAAPASLADVRSLHALAADVVGRLDPESIALPNTIAAYEALQQVARLATSASTLLLRRVGAARHGGVDGHQSTVSYVAAEAGVSPQEATRMLDTSRRLQELPATAAAARDGRLSARQLDRVADAAAENPDAEAHLLEVAQHGTHHELRSEATKARQAVVDREAQQRRIHKHRALHTWVDDEGAWNLRAKGTTADGALIEQALAPLTEHRFEQAKRAGTDGYARHDTYAFDALVELAKGEPGVTQGGDAASDSTVAPPRQPRTVNPRHQLHVRVDIEAFMRGYVEGDELCDIIGIGPVPLRRAVELLGQAGLDLVLTKGVDVAAIVPIGRNWTARQRLIARWQQPNCSVRGCHNPRCDIDHRTEWQHGGKTTLSNAQPLCRYHHQLKTKGWALIGPPGNQDLVPPTDPRHPTRAGP